MMSFISDCVVANHSLWLVVVAALACACASLASFDLFFAAQRTAGAAQIRLLALAGGICGLGIWTTHFLAILAYDPSLPMAFSLSKTLMSLGVVWIGAVASFTLTRWNWNLPLCGALIGLAAWAMHYLGVFAVQTLYTVAWAPGLVGASLSIAVSGGALAFALASQPKTPRAPRNLVPAGLFTLALCGLHFTGMGAMTVLPHFPAMASPDLVNRGVLAAMVSVTFTMVMASLLVQRAMSGHARKLTQKSVAAAFQEVPVGLAQFDAEGRLKLWNSAYEAINEGMGLELKAGHERTAGMVELVRAQLREDPCFGEEITGAWRLTGGKGRIFEGEDRRAWDGGFIRVVQDVTQARLDALALAAARDAAEAASAAKSQFLTNMNHEVRTPLNGILGMLQAMERERLDTDQAVRLQVMKDSALNLLGVLNGVLDLSKVEAGELELDPVAFDVETLLSGVLSPFTDIARHEGLKLTLEVDKEAAGSWIGDRARISQVIASILSNAVKFTPKGEVAVCAFLVEDRLSFTIRDTGLGIEPETLADLFDSFAQGDSSMTRRHGGLGVGLAISRHLMELMHGTIDVRSVLGQGSTFQIEIPLPRANAPAQRPRDLGELTGDDLPPRILAVEDNRANQQVLRALLQPVGAELTLVDNGKEAVSAYFSGSFDLILMDIQMPEMNGVEATLVIRAFEKKLKLKPTPIIALTANTMRGQVDDYLAAGMSDCIPKPIEVNRLYAAIQAALEPKVVDQVLQPLSSIRSS